MATKTDTTKPAPVAAAPKAAVKKVATKKVAAKAKAKTKRAPRAKVDPKLVSDMIALLKSVKGATYSEIADKLKIKSKGDAPHQSPKAQVRALVRDQVRKSHEIVDGDFNTDRGGQIYMIK
jgi:hypothetical protein